MADKIDEILLGAGLVDEARLAVARSHAEVRGGRVAAAVVEDRFATEEQVVNAIAMNMRLQRANLATAKKDELAVKKVDYDFGRLHAVLPLALMDNGKTLVVAMADPTDVKLVDQLALKTKLRIKPVVAGEQAIMTALDRFYFGGMTDTSSEMRTLDLDEGDGEALELATDTPAPEAEAAPGASATTTPAPRSAAPTSPAPRSPTLTPPTPRPAGAAGTASTAAPGQAVPEQWGVEEAKYVFAARKPKAAVDLEALKEEVQLDEARKREIVELEARLESDHFFALLGVPPGASPDECKKAYYELSRRFHPDRYFRKQLGSFKERIDKIFKKIHEAQDALTDLEKREAYLAANPDVAPAPAPRPTAPAPVATKPVARGSTPTQPGMPRPSPQASSPTQTGMPRPTPHASSPTQTGMPRPNPHASTPTQPGMPRPVPAAAAPGPAQMANPAAQPPPGYMVPPGAPPYMPTPTPMYMPMPGAPGQMPPYNVMNPGAQGWPAPAPAAPPPDSGTADLLDSMLGSASGGEADVRETVEELKKKLAALEEKHEKTTKVLHAMIDIFVERRYLDLNELRARTGKR